MANSDDFVAHLMDMVSPPGAITPKRMFGGHGLFRDGVMVGLIADDTLYLKVDDGNRAEFEAAGSHPFVYEAKGKRTEMSYYLAPADAMEDPDALSRWFFSAFEAALRASKAKSKKKT